MRIRRNAARLLGSAYSASAAPTTVDAAPRPSFDLPPPLPPPCSAPESSSGPGFASASASSAEPCELSRSPWDLVADLSLSDQKEEDELMDKYFVHVTTRASWLFSATMPATSTKKKQKKKLPAAASTKKKKTLPAAAAYGDSTQLRREAVKRAAMNKEKEGETKKKAKVMKEEGQDDGAARRVWMCKKNDGRRWHCNRPVSQPDTLCEYHFVQRRSYLNPFHPEAELEEEAAPAARAPVQAAASKSSTTSSKPQAAASKYSSTCSNNKPRKKTKKKPGNDCSATEGFYYYAGFGPFRSKRQCRSAGMNMNNEPLPAKQEEEEETPEDSAHPTDEAPAEVAEFTNQLLAACQDVSSGDNDDIAGVDEAESSDDEYKGIGIAGCDMNGTVDLQGTGTGEGKRKAPWKRWKKPVKARSLKSLM